MTFSELDAIRMREGTHARLFEVLGAHRTATGVRFDVWAPRATAVSVVGNFNAWTPGMHAMTLEHGVWSAEIAGITSGALYKYHLTTATGATLWKADPFARRQEREPNTASIAWFADYVWRDAAWMAARKRDLAAPMSIYEVHLGSWDRSVASYVDIAPKLIAHVTALGFTHVELMPLTEHPFYGSWGYETTGYFAATGRYGTPEQLKGLIDALHAAGIGVLLDWVPAHFPTDEHGLAKFDGEPLYEHPDPRLGFHADWDTAIPDFGREEVRSFLLSSALFWLEEFHVDGLRVDGVASMLYRDYGRAPGEWIPNARGGNEYFEAVELLQRLNRTIAREAPTTIAIAEESTAWPHVTGEQGLGFALKWDMGWMHDTLRYLARDPIHRKYHHSEITFRSTYGYDEHYVLPLSHDEVVHGKGSLIGKMPGEPAHQRATLRLLYAYMFSTPGKKLLFMGDEFAQQREWSHDASLDWEHGDRQIMLLVGTLARLYREHRALHELDFDPSGFAWRVADDAERSVFVYERRARDGKRIVVALNFTPVARPDYLQLAGEWRILLDTDDPLFGGTGAARLVRGSVSLAPLGALYLITAA